jgi:hypothetical protein
VDRRANRAVLFRLDDFSRISCARKGVFAQRIAKWEAFLRANTPHTPSEKVRITRRKLLRKLGQRADYQLFPFGRGVRANQSGGKDHRPSVAHLRSIAFYVLPLCIASRINPLCDKDKRNEGFRPESLIN